MGLLIQLDEVKESSLDRLANDDFQVSGRPFVRQFSAEARLGGSPAMEITNHGYRSTFPVTRMNEKSSRSAVKVPRLCVEPWLKQTLLMLESRQG
jgi:hypothetical protein